MLRLHYKGAYMKQGRSLKEAKAERTAKKKRARKRKRAVVLGAEIFIFLILLGVGYAMSKYGKIQLNLFGDDDIQFNQGVQQKGYTTIALFGGDSRDGQLGAGTHADTMMLVSIDNQTKEVKVVSVYRDLLTKQKDGKIQKANSAYFIGGPKDAINMLNQNFDLAIEDYVTVDFTAMADVVDLLGGVEIDVTDKEAEEMNLYIDETASIVGKKSSVVKSGNQILNGVEALTYSRIRKNVGGDYARTERQRRVVEQLAIKVKDTDLSTINDIIDQAFPKISTSFTLKDILQLATGIFEYELGETKGFAFEYTDGTVEGVGSAVIPLNMTKNVEELHAFLYPKEEYHVSDTVKDIAGQIETISKSRQ